MACKKEELCKVYKKLIELGTNSAENEECKYQYEDMTEKQVYYLQLIDRRTRMTFSELARETRNSKPTITELIGKLITSDCVYRQRSDEDRRVYYIFLTPKGKMIARAQEKAHYQLVEQIQNKLDAQELDLLISLLYKIF